MDRELVDKIHLIYLEGVDIQGKIMALKKEDYSLDEIYEAMKTLYFNEKISIVKGKMFERCFSRGGQGNHILIIYADHFRIA